MKRIFLSSVALAIGLLGYSQNYLWGTYAYGTIPGCGNTSNDYTPVETYVNPDYSLLSGGEITGNTSCDPSYGGIDIKVVKSNINGSVEYIKKYGTSGDDHLIKILDGGNGRNLLIGNTITNSIPSIFILLIDAQGNIISQVDLTQNTPNGAMVLDAERVGDSPIGHYGSIHLTGVEDDKMFYSEVLMSTNNTFFQVHHEVLDVPATRGKSIEVAPYQDIFRVLITGDKELWTIEPFYASPTFQRAYLPIPYGNFTTVETKGNEIILGTDEGEILICDPDLTTVSSYKSYGLNLGGPAGTSNIAISDIEITSDNHIVAGGIHYPYGQQYNSYFRIDMNGAMQAAGHTQFTLQSTYRNNMPNKFGLDLFDNFCINMGLNLVGLTAMYEQERVVMVSRLDKDFSDNCTWNPLYLDEIDMGNSGIVLNPESNTSSSLNAGYNTYQAIANGNGEETVCQGFNCTGQSYEYAEAVDQTDPLSPITAMSIGDPESSNYIPWGFRGPSGGMEISTNHLGAQFFQITYVLDGVTYILNGFPYIFPDGVSSFTMFIIDQNGCPHFTEYGIGGTGVGDPDARKKNSLTNDETQEMTIFPNPSDGNFNILFDAEEFERITVYNVEGKVVKEVFLSAETNKVQLDLSDQPKGIFMVTATGNTTRKTMKIMKQ